MNMEAFGIIEGSQIAPGTWPGLTQNQFFALSDVFRAFLIDYELWDTAKGFSGLRNLTAALKHSK